MNNLPNFKEEKELWKAGYRLVIGVDEVGRGAFAGPLVASAVSFSCHAELGSASPEILKRVQDDNGIRIDDSKRLKPLQRKKAAKWIKEFCLAYGIGEVGVRIINRVGIGKATTMAMRKAVGKILRDYDIKILSKKKRKEPNILVSQYPSIFILVDAFHIKYLRGIGLKHQKAIKRGDQKSISIAAASILAKVYRDRLMQKLTKRYRKYHWGKNKGYGTKKHQQEIIKNGTTPLHRVQFVQTFLEKRTED